MYDRRDCVKKRDYTDEIMELKEYPGRFSILETLRNFWGKGWQSVIIRGITFAVLVFVANLVFTALSVSKSTRIGYGQRVVFSGNCDEVKRLETYSHVVINVLSTILLGASNYAMQCLSAPTRQEVDKAHQHKKWLDIGVLSMRNLSSIDSRRVLLWCLLATSSIPLHLFYNSTIYSSIYAPDYAIFTTTENYLTKNASSHTLGIDAGYPYTKDNQTKIGYYWDDAGGFYSNYTLVNLTSALYNSAISQKLTRLNISECMSFYATAFPTNQGSLILVTENATSTPYVSGYQSMSPIQGLIQQCTPDPYSWMCNQVPSNNSCSQRLPCSKKLSQIAPEDWRPYGNKIEYCLSQTLEQRCTLTLNSPLMIVVMMFNLAKALLLLCALYTVTANPLMILGDAISSFVENRDRTTSGMCLLDRNDLSDWKNSRPSPEPIRASGKRWNSTISKARWAFVMTLFGTMLTICVFLFFHGIFRRAVSAATLMALPLGSQNAATFISGWAVPSFGISGLLSNVFVANSVQLLLSMIYFTYNSLFTSFLLAAEWNSYSTKRKSLRVSANPAVGQRGTYFLQLPLRWATPLLVLSALLHWLCSQSIYLVSIEFDHTITQDPNFNGWLSCGGSADSIAPDITECFDQYFTCGYSPVAILATILTGLVMIIFAVLIGLRRYGNESMPVAGSCSAAISASCHMLQRYDASHEDEPNKSAGHSKLQWGEVDTPLISGSGIKNTGGASKVHAHAKQQVFHCSFSHQEVRTPARGKLYA